MKLSLRLMAQNTRFMLRWALIRRDISSMKAYLSKNAFKVLCMVSRRSSLIICCGLRGIEGTGLNIRCEVYVLVVQVKDETILQYHNGQPA